MTTVMLFVMASLGILSVLYNRRSDGTSQIVWPHWIAAAVTGFFVSGMNYCMNFQPLMPFAPVFLIIMVALSVAVVVLYRKNGSSLVEVLVSLFLLYQFYLVTETFAYVTSSIIWPVRPVSSIVAALPWRVFLLCGGFIVVDFLYYLYRHNENVLWRIIAWIVKLFIIAVFVSSLGLQIPKIDISRLWSGRALLRGFDTVESTSGNESATTTEVAATESGEPVATEVAATESGESATTTEAVAIEETSEAVDYSWLHWYNLDLLNNQDPEDNYNFGESPVVAEGTPEDYDKEVRSRMWDDPALGAADMAWLDSIVGTRYLGEFYESCKGDWAKTMNMSKDTWAEDWDLYHRTLTAFFKYLDNADEMYIEVRQSGLEDQMYMNPYTITGVPDVIVLKTPDRAGTFLVYAFVIKGVRFEVAYRCDCGFQPANVEKIMRIEPLEEPPEPVYSPSIVEETTKTPKTTRAEEEEISNPKIETDPSKPVRETDSSKPHKEETEPSEPETTKKETEPTKPETTTAPPETTKKETDPPKPETTTAPPETTKKETDPPKPERPSKEPEEAPSENLEPNDDIKGPGKDNNAGVGAERSLEDQAENSDHLDSYEEYKEKVKELEEANTPKQEETTKAKETEAPKPETTKAKETEAPKPETVKAPETTKVDSHEKEAERIDNPVFDMPADGSPLTNETGDGAWGEPID